MEALIDVTYLCAACGSENETAVDPSGGSHQHYTEDCAVCCRPNVLDIRIEPGPLVTVSVEFEG